jgi:hypothetical protein
LLYKSAGLFDVRGYRCGLLGGVSLAALLLIAPLAHAQQSVVNLAPINVNASGTTTQGGYATKANYHRATASMGPLGRKSILTPPPNP